MWLLTSPVTPDYIKTSIGDLEASLAVLDMSTKTVTNYCITTTENYLDYPFLWSPDSLQLVFETRDAEGKRTTILVDIKANRASVIGEELWPRFWLPDLPAFWLTGG